MRGLAHLALGMALFAVTARAEVLTIPGTLVGYGIPQGWQITGDGVTWDKDGVYVWADAQGNCHYEYKQECYAGPNGQWICHQVPVWKCDQATAFYKLPPSVTVDENAKRAFLAAPGATPLAFGETKKFLWSKWIRLFDGATTQVSYTAAGLALDTDKLHQSLRQENFLELYATQP